MSCVFFNDNLFIKIFFWVGYLSPLIYFLYPFLIKNFII